MCLDLPSTRAEMTFPKAERDKLIFVAFSSGKWMISKSKGCWQQGLWYWLLIMMKIWLRLLERYWKEKLTSFKRSPVASVLLCLSLPARSTRFSLPWCGDDDGGDDDGGDGDSGDDVMMMWWWWCGGDGDGDHANVSHWLLYGQALVSPTNDVV